MIPENQYQNVKTKNTSYNKIKNEIKLYQNMPCILDKLEQDGNVIKLTKTFESIFSQEILYAISGKFKKS